MKAKTMVVPNEIPIDIRKLLIKRKTKESFEFIMHYIDLDGLDNMKSKQVNDIYTTFKPLREV
jgi:hypothetical protein